MSNRTHKLIITAALTGGDTFPTQSPYLPIKPEEIAEEAYKSYQEGSSIVHVHAREPDTGKPTSSLKIWAEILTKIKEKCDVVVCLSTGGISQMPATERIAIIPEFQPELCSFDVESMNYGVFPTLSRPYKWKEWEIEQMESSKWEIFKNSFQDLEIFAKTMKKYHSKPECEVYGTNGLYNLRYLVREKLVDVPFYIQFVLGVLGGTAAYPQELMHLQTEALRIFGSENFSWSTIGVGYPREFQLAALSIAMGGHVRVGFEDNIYLRYGTLAKSNSELVKEVCKIADLFGREIATPEDARKILHLKGVDKVNF